MPLRRIGLQAHRDEERPWVGVGRGDPQVGEVPYPSIKGIYDRMATLKPTTTSKDSRPDIQGSAREPWPRQSLRPCWARIVPICKVRTGLQVGKPRDPRNLRHVRPCGGRKPVQLVVSGIAIGRAKD